VRAILGYGVLASGFMAEAMVIVWPRMLLEWSTLISAAVILVAIVWGVRFLLTAELRHREWQKELRREMLEECRRCRYHPPGE
jgi:membrane protein YdbS with pleckstrin-like domain